MSDLPPSDLLELPIYFTMLDQALNATPEEQRLRSSP
jgi:hypothetical protein